MKQMVKAKTKVFELIKKNRELSVFFVRPQSGQGQSVPVENVSFYVQKPLCEQVLVEVLKHRLWILR